MARAGPDTIRYGGDTSAVEVRESDGSLLILDAGSGVDRLGAALSPCPARIDLLLSHLHMDHVQGLGFFRPLFDPAIEVHIWGPVSSYEPLTERLTRYLSPPLFPVRLRELPNLIVHDLGAERFEIGPFKVTSDLVIHPGVTLGYRIESRSKVLAYLCDHEPALGSRKFPDRPAWTSGMDLARGADLLVHDAQYTDAEYEERVGWGHSSLRHALALAAMAEVGRLVTFHHDPDHSDDFLDRQHELAGGDPPVTLLPGQAGAVFEV